MRLMSEQEQEHVDHVAGCASEFQNCFEEASIERCRQAGAYRQAIDDVLVAGRFAVVSTAPYFCKATDAFVGVVEYLRGDFATREAADAAALALYGREYEAHGFDIGEDLYVLPRAPQVEEPTALGPNHSDFDPNDNDVPF
jgi:hypothetical protein